MTCDSGSTSSGVPSVFRLSDDTPTAISGGADEERITLGSLVLERHCRQARYRERILHLTRREFSILWSLASQPGKVFERREVLERAWGPKEFVEPRTIDTHVVKLRRKLKELGITEIRIETIWGLGYRLQANP